MLLARLIEMLLTRLIEALLACPLLTLIGCRTHALATTIRLSTSLVAVAVHGRPGPVGVERVRAIEVRRLMLNPAVASDQTVISVASSVGLIWPKAVISVARLVVVVAVAIVIVSVTVVVVAVPVDNGSVDIGIVVVVDVSTAASTAPIHTPGAEAPAATAAEATRNKPAAADRSPNGDTCAEGNAGRNCNRRCIGRHHQGRTEDQRWVVLRNIDHIARGGFNDDGLRALPHDLDLA